MGPRNSKDSTSNFMKDYEVIHRNPVDNITFLNHNQSHEEFLLREFNFNDKKESDKVMEKLAELKVKLGGNKHVVPLKDYLMNSEDQYCSTFYKIYALFQYPQRTLDDEINQRNLQKRKFSQTQLWSILASCILGLSHLQRNGYKHSALKSSSILLSQEGIIKVSDPFANGATSNYDTAITKRSTPHLYLSPEQSACLQQETITPNLNHYKSDIWTMGMIILEAGLLEYQDDCYRDDWSRIQWQTLHYNINRFGQIYSEELKNMLEFMLSRDERVRPDWIDLEQHVMKGQNQVKRSFIQEEKNNNSVIINANNGGTMMGPGRPSLESDISHRHTISIAGKTDRFSSSPNTVRTLQPRGPSLPISGQPSYPNVFAPYPTQSPRATSNSNNHPVFHPPSQSFQPDPYPQYKPVNSPNNNHNQSNIMPSKPSNIENTRPTRNIFPFDSYKIKTTIDENLIMVEDQQDTESDRMHDLQPSDRNSYMPLSNNQPFSMISDNQNHHIVQSKLTQANPRYSPHQNSSPNYSDSHRYPAQSQGSRNIPSFDHRPHSQFQQSQMRYVEQVFKMGSRYEGYKMNGMRHGPGKFYYQDGGMYDGEWKQNKMDGQGKLYYQSGKLAYDGNWRGDQFSGKGVLYNEIPDILQGSYNYQNFDDIDQFWTKYQGQFSQDMKNGRGILYLSNGQKFQGEFVADIVEGYGVFYAQNGRQIRGRWAGNQKIA